MTDHYSAYFLGANTVQGFYSCYDTFCNTEQEDFLWVIKGGPGCGKSTFMKQIAAAAEADGLDVEYVLCSADPDSVDGVYIPQWHVGYVDGTSPHVQEVQIPGAGGSYLDLGQFYDLNALRSLRGAITENQRAYRALYARIYELLRSYPYPCARSDHAWRRAARARFYRALTHKGCMSLYPRRCAIVGIESVNDLAQQALEDHKTIIDIRHPLFGDLTEGLCLPQEQLLLRAVIPEADDKLQQAAASVCPLLKQAKQLHDELEGIYHPYVDFAGVSALAEKHIKLLKNENNGL